MWAKILSDLGTLITTITIIDRVAYLIMLAISESLTQELFFNTMIIMAFALAIRFLLLWTSSKAIANISSKIKIEIRDQIYSKILELELGYRDVRALLSADFH
jgi:ABC-type transport system involved in cytochrome bd biosynthesis fused ATPase/permease subunit